MKKRSGKTLTGPVISVSQFSMATGFTRRFARRRRARTSRRVVATGPLTTTYTSPIERVNDDRRARGHSDRARPALTR